MTEKSNHARLVQTPTTTTRPDGTTVSEHPAYGQVTISRVSGSARLYGSDFAHMGFIRIRIHPSKLHQDSSDLRASAGFQPHVELDMSEAQWATLLSSMNAGEGVQCTLRRLAGEVIPDLPAPVPRNQSFRLALQERMQSAVRLIRELEVDILASGISKTKAADMIRKSEGARMQILSNAGYVSEMFDEHIEESTQKAAMEINGFMSGAVRAAGLEALANGHRNPMVALVMGEPAKDDDDYAAPGQAEGSAPGGG